MALAHFTLGTVPKATNTPSECVILIAFPMQQRLHERDVTLLVLLIMTYLLVIKHTRNE
jgi:hypothetical protein